MAQNSTLYCAGRIEDLVPRSICVLIWPMWQSLIGLTKHHLGRPKTLTPRSSHMSTRRYVTMRKSRPNPHSAIAPNWWHVFWFAHVFKWFTTMAPGSTNWADEVQRDPTIFDSPWWTFLFRCYVANGKLMSLLLVPWHLAAFSDFPACQNMFAWPAVNIFWCHKPCPPNTRTHHQSTFRSAGCYVAMKLFRPTHESDMVPMVP